MLTDPMTTPTQGLVDAAVEAIQLIVGERYADAVQLILRRDSSGRLVPAQIVGEDEDVLWESDSEQGSWLYTALSQCVAVLDRYATPSTTRVDLIRG